MLLVLHGAFAMSVRLDRRAGDEVQIVLHRGDTPPGSRIPSRLAVQSVITDQIVDPMRESRDDSLGLRQCLAFIRRELNRSGHSSSVPVRACIQ